MPERRLERFKARAKEAVRKVAGVREPARNAFFRVTSFLSRLPRDFKVLKESFRATVLKENGKPVAAVKVVGRIKGKALLLVVPALAGCMTVQSQGGKETRLKLLPPPVKTAPSTAPTEARVAPFGGLPGIVERARAAGPTTTASTPGVRLLRLYERGGSEERVTVRKEPFIIGVDRDVETSLAQRGGRDLNSLTFDAGRVANLRDAEVSAFLETENFFSGPRGGITEKVPHAGTGSGDVTTRTPINLRESLHLSRFGVGVGKDLTGLLRKGNISLGFSNARLVKGSERYGVNGFHLGGRLEAAPIPGVQNVQAVVEGFMERVGSISNDRLRAELRGTIPLTREGQAVAHVPRELSTAEKTAAAAAGAKIEATPTGYDLIWDLGLTHTQISKGIDELEGQAGIGLVRKGKRGSETGLRAFLVFNPATREGQAELHFGRSMGVGAQGWWTVRPGWPTVVADIEYRGSGEMSASLGIDIKSLLGGEGKKKPSPAAEPIPEKDRERMRYYYAPPAGRPGEHYASTSYRPQKTTPRSGKRSR